jgi:thiosulfate/3-mercaptopyruvate sulfurtransferase
VTQEVLVSTDWLSRHLQDDTVRVLDICSMPENKRYREGHVPGAAWAYWKSVCWHATDREMISSEEMARILGGMGVGPDTTLVLCGDPVQFGAYAFWAFTMAGHRKLRLLDGGRKKWLAEGRPLSAQVPGWAPVNYPVPPAGQCESRVGRRNVRERLGDPNRLLLDVRSSEEYKGERVIDYSFSFDHGAERKGRIPGSVHLYYKNLLNEDESFRSPDALRQLLDAVGAAPDKVKDIVCYCRLSHRATLAWVAMTRILDYPCVKVYDGSWTEWGSIVGYPIEI